ncbi:PREDICTED: uncharacterized protein LOC108782940 [Cyphomyrmex costatus]|uniref:uncharacterized protein LOC108782940 n=1 Tax=Cyphomyrmex costatus TaxID=456900 RepID=UPI00085243D3|nr:PREDICTED: uncharacterized protein LOC108782940 [Cyphomyrmex costatus]
MNPDDVKCNNVHLEKIFNKLLDVMRKQCPLFDKTFQKIEWAGSYYKGTRVGQPEEYDLNFVIDLPFKEKDLEFSTDRPGFTKIRVVRKDRLNMDPDSEAYKKLKSFIDEESYLNQEEFRGWIEGIFSKVTRTTNGNNGILIDGYSSAIKIHKSGPAFTLKFPLPEGRTINIDIVPVLAFSVSTLPPKCSKYNVLQSAPYRHWSAVPKPLDNDKGDNLQYRYWRLCFYEFEKDMLISHDYGRMKPVIRQLKKLRDTQKWKSVASYYLETLCYHEKEMFMLRKLRDAFYNGKIEFYWDDDYNLLGKIKPMEMKNMENRLNNILKHIKKKAIEKDRYAIATYVLNDHDLNTLKNSDSVSKPKPEPELENCKYY